MGTNDKRIVDTHKRKHQFFSRIFCIFTAKATDLQMAGSSHTFGYTSNDKVIDAGAPETEIAPEMIEVGVRVRWDRCR
jgi:hypothetical protein